MRCAGEREPVATLVPHLPPPPAPSRTHTTHPPLPLPQSVTRPDWSLPGSVANAQLGTFGSQFSVRGDGGVNNGDGAAEGNTYSVWATGGSPYLANVGTSRGSFYGAGVGDWDLITLYVSRPPGSGQLSLSRAPRSRAHGTHACGRMWPFTCIFFACAPYSSRLI